MSAIFAWETPPAKTRVVPVGRRSRFADALEELRKYPGQSARITETPLDGSKAGSHAARIRNGGVADTTPGEFDATDHEGHVFATYIGQEGIDKHAAAVLKRAERKAAKEKAAADAAAKGEAPPADDSDDDDDDDLNVPADPDDDQEALFEDGAAETAEASGAGAWG